MNLIEFETKIQKINNFKSNWKRNKKTENKGNLKFKFGPIKWKNDLRGKWLCRVI